MVFRLGDAWFMMFILFDGKGYETHLSKSDDGCWIDHRRHRLAKRDLSLSRSYSRPKNIVKLSHRVTTPPHPPKNQAILQEIISRFSKIIKSVKNIRNGFISHISTRGMRLSAASVPATRPKGRILRIIPILSILPILQSCQSNSALQAAKTPRRARQVEGGGSAANSMPSETSWSE